jgi:hypothetical protein
LETGMRSTSYLFAATMACMGSAHAATVFENNLPSGALDLPGSITESFNTSAGPGSLSVQIAGYLSLDGENCCTDVFHIAVNGSEIFAGSFNLGGGGTDVVYLNTNGATYAAYTPGLWSGGTLDISAPIALVAGTNTLTFSYSGGGQGLGDEAWGVNKVSVTAAVPEPETYALMLAGLAALGFIARRRKGA